MSEKSLRVAIVYDCFFPTNSGGGERVYRRIAERFVELGHTVDYLTRDQWMQGDRPEATFGIVPVWRGEIYDGGGTRKSSSALKFALAVFRTLCRRRGRYDLVIASALPVLTLLAARLALVGSRTFLVDNWLEIWGWRKWRRYAGLLAGTVAFVLQLVAARAANLHTVDSRFTSDRLRAYDTYSQPVTLGLVDLGGHGKPMCAASKPPYVLVVGRLIADKRTAVVPAAVAFARSIDATIELRVVGRGPEEAALAAEITRLRLGEATALLGRVEEHELHELMHGASVLVNASEREGFGLVVAEAASHGVPSVVVRADDNAAVDLIDSGVNGYIAESTSPEVLGQAIVDAVAAGLALRQSTEHWFERQRIENGLDASVNEIIRRYLVAR